jgi:hypothetical protein
MIMSRINILKIEYNTMGTRIDIMPQLRQICWNRRTDITVSDEDALALYERNWSMVDLDKMTEPERAYLDGLIETVGHGTLMPA